MTTATIIQVGIYLATLAGGYLLRHYGVQVPFLPTPSAPGANASSPSSSSSSSGVDHAGLLRQVLAVGKTEAEVLLQQAVRAIIGKALADAQAAAAPQIPTPPKS